MALGFTDEFQRVVASDRLQVIYVDTQHGRLETIVPAGAQASAMRDLLDVPTYLEVQGATLRRANSDDPAWLERTTRRRDLTLRLGRDLRHPDYQKVLGVLNYHAAHALGDGGTKLAQPAQKLARRPVGALERLLGDLSRMGLVEWKTGSCELVFPDAQAARYVAGGWLEEFVWLAATDCRPFDARAGAVITWEAESKKHAPRNEFDLICTHHNRMLVVECKARVKWGKAPEGPTATMFKLESLARMVGGALVTKWLVVLQELDGPAKERARNARIEIHDSRRLRWFREAVARWMEAG